MADSLFDQDQIDNNDYLSELTGPGGKFDKTKYASEVEMYKAIAKGKVYGDRAIDFKNKEFDELREEYLKVRADNIAKDKWEELLKTKGQQLPPQEPDYTPPGQPPSIKPEDLEPLLKKGLAEMRAQEKEAENMAKVETRLRERFGENARTILRDKMNTLNLSDEDVKSLARRSPEAVFNTLGLNDKQDTYQAPPRGSLRTDNFSNQGELRDYVFYDKMRKEDPKKYFSEKMSVQRMKDMDSDAVKWWDRFNQQRT